jgi:hypothetical protein
LTLGWVGLRGGLDTTHEEWKPDTLYDLKKVRIKAETSVYVEFIKWFKEERT